MKNKYYQRSRISEKLFEKLIKKFADDYTATHTSALTQISIRSVNKIYLNLRRCMKEELDREWSLVKQNHKDSIIVSRRPMLRPCKHNGQKILVLVLSQHKNQVHLDVVPDARKSKSNSDLRKRALIVNAQNEQAEQLWRYLDKRLLSFRGLSADTFNLHVKETAFRFNYQEKLYGQLISILERRPL